MAAQTRKRLRRKDAGFIGVDLAIGGDMTLFNQLEETVKADPELTRSKVVRLALREYFDRRSSKVNG